MTYSILKAIKPLGLALVFFAMAFAAPVQAQRIATVDMNTILESIQEYQDAQKELDRIAATWQQEVAKMYDEIKSMYNRYQAEQILLSDEERKQREDEIMEKERQVREYQKAKFGPEGELFQRRKELVQPIQDRVYAAIEEYANERGYDFIFDKSSTAGLIFNNSEYDITDEILKRLSK